MNKLKFLLLFLILPNLAKIYAQELDESFLKSLPDDVRSDLVSRASENSKNNQENFRPSINTSQFEQAEELAQLKQRLEKDLIALEKRLKSDKELILKKDLDIFGANFFSTFQTSFMPINEPYPD